MDGCLTYATKWVSIHFPGGTVCCACCPLLETYARKQCRRTGEYIADDRYVGIWCPLTDYPDAPDKASKKFIDDEGDFKI